MPKSRRLTPPVVLEAIGQAAYGRHWIGPLAKDLEISETSIRRWLNGKLELPADHGVFSDLVDVLAERKAELSRASNFLIDWINDVRPK